MNPKESAGPQNPEINGTPNTEQQGQKISDLLSTNVGNN